MIKKDAPKVVYWLGAGASYNALPIVGEMPEAFEAQRYVLRTSMPAGLSRHLTRHDSTRYFEYLLKMAEWSRQYGTIDTYARSLFLQGKEDELAELKLHLSMYFMLSQVLPMKYKKGTGVVPPKYKKRDRIDTRYMGLLALLMDKDKLLPENVSMVSWNYDLQLDLAIAKFRGYTTMEDLVTKEARLIAPRADGSKWEDNEQPTIVRLNGVSGLAQVRDKYHYLCYSVYCNDSSNEEFIKGLFELYKDYDKDGKDMLHGGMDTLTFAWEGNAMAEENISFAEKAMREAEVLIVIGYSFPSFNRQVDKRLFQAFLEQEGRYKMKRTVLQNQRLTPDTFRQIMGNPLDEELDIIQELDLDQFYLPPGLF